MSRHQRLRELAETRERLLTETRTAYNALEEARTADSTSESIPELEAKYNAICADAEAADVEARTLQNELELERRMRALEDNPFELRAEFRDPDAPNTPNTCLLYTSPSPRDS